MTDPPLAEDPETGVPLQRVFHPIAVHFKGKGFYNTDYGTKKRQRENAETQVSEKKSDDAKQSDSAAASSDSSKAVQKPDGAKSDATSSSSSSTPKPKPTKG